MRPAEGGERAQKLTRGPAAAAAAAAHGLVTDTTPVRPAALPGCQALRLLLTKHARCRDKGLASPGGRQGQLGSKAFVANQRLALGCRQQHQLSRGDWHADEPHEAGAAANREGNRCSVKS